jgi:hypothetical protein
MLPGREAGGKSEEGKGQCHAVTARFSTTGTDSLRLRVMPSTRRNQFFNDEFGAELCLTIFTHMLAYNQKENASAPSSCPAEMS